MFSRLRHVSPFHEITHPMDHVLLITDPWWKNYRKIHYTETKTVSTYLKTVQNLMYLLILELSLGAIFVCLPRFNVSLVAKTDMYYNSWANLFFMILQSYDIEKQGLNTVLNFSVLCKRVFYNNFSKWPPLSLIKSLISLCIHNTHNSKHFFCNFSKHWALIKSYLYIVCL